MVLRVGLILFFIVIVKGQETVVEKFYDQKLQHEGSSETWKQRYLENREYFKGDGAPVFISYGGAFYAPVSPDVLKTGSMVQYAKQQGAALILLEERFYGKSRPTSDVSVANLNKYSKFEYTFKDLTAFIQWLKTQPEFKNSKVVGFGHAFMGSAIIQVARNQPGLIDVSVLSSTIVDYRFEFPELMKKAVELMKKSNPECANTVHDGILCFDKIIHGEDCGGHNLKDVKKTFNLCTDVNPDNKLDNAALVGEILILLDYVVLFNNPKAPYNLDVMCRGMGDNSSLTAFEKLAREVKTILKNSKKPCLEFKFQDIVAKYKTDDWEAPVNKKGNRQFLHFKCRNSMTLKTPEGLMLGDGRVQSFRDYRLEECKQLFNMSPDQVRQNSQTTNELYGKRRIPEKCAIFVSEGEDLVQELEITEQSEAGKCNQVVKSEGGSFNSDASEIEDEAGTGVKEVKLRVGRLLDAWLQTGDCCAPVSKRAIEYQPSILTILHRN